MAWGRCDVFPTCCCVSCNKGRLPHGPLLRSDDFTQTIECGYNLQNNRRAEGRSQFRQLPWWLPGTFPRRIWLVLVGKIKRGVHLLAGIWPSSEARRSFCEAKIASNSAFWSLFSGQASPHLTAHTQRHGLQTPNEPAGAAPS